ncbi:MAG: TonB-dependent receptor [Gammaproteobacteria bacterium]|nr:TonB-dependent receptor [Gammaproteobacteria bacterium]
MKPGSALPQHALSGLLLACIGLGAGSTTVIAAESSAIPEVIVTAQRRAENLQTVPVAVSAFNAEMLEARQVLDTQDLQAIVPSMKLTNNVASVTVLQPALRGSLQQDASVITAEAPFGIYVDDVYIGRLNGNNMTLNDIDRVEVLRGPQGTLYGRNTLAGALKFQTRTPTLDNTWLDVGAGVGNYDQAMLKLSAGGPLSGGWAGSIATLYSQKEGQFKNVLTGEDSDSQRNRAVRAKLHYDASDVFDLVLSGSFIQTKHNSLQLIHATTPGVDDVHQFSSNDLVPTYGYYRVSTPSNPAAMPPPRTPSPEGDTKQAIASINASYDFGAFQLRSITGYVKTKDFWDTDFSGRGRIHGASWADVDQWTEELHLSGKAFDSRMNYLLGLYYLNERGDQELGWALGAMGPAASNGQMRTKTDSYAVFGQLDYLITDALKATAGIRWAKDDKEFSYAFRGYFPPATPLSDFVHLEDDWSEVTPRFGLDYSFDPFWRVDSLMAYASVSKGYKAGGYNGINIMNANDAKLSYDPETNWTYEGGIKMDALDRRVRLNMAYFWADIDDLTAQATAGLAFPVANVGDAEVHGVELDLTMVPVDGLSVYWNAVFQHGAYGDIDPAAAPSQATYKYQVHPRVPQVPSHAYTVGFDYDLPVNIGKLDSGLRFGMDWFRTASYITSATNDFRASSYDRLNGYLGLDINRHWSVRLDVKNIRNSKDITSGSRGTAVTRRPDGTISAPGGGLGGFIIMPPREWMLQVNYRM